MGGPGAPAAFEAWMRETHAVQGDLSFPGFLARTAARTPDSIALRYGDADHTYAGLFARIETRARSLRADWGVETGDRIGLLAENSDLNIIAFLAIQLAGAVAVPINTKLTAAEIGYILGDCQATMIVHDASFAAVVEASQTAATAVDLAVWSPQESEHPLPRVPVSAPAAIYYTSGTTGRPKGVVLNHFSVIAVALQAPVAFEYAITPLTVLAVTPLFHIAQHVLFLPVLQLGGTLVIARYQTSTIFDLLDQHRPTSFFAVPSMLLMMLGISEQTGRRVESVRRLQFGAAPIPAQKLKEIQGMFPNARLIHGMGQTECCGLAVTLDSGLAFAKAGSVGSPIPGCEIDIVDDADRSMAAGTVGELVCRGPNVMQGYYGSPDATAATLRNGWLHTGDIGYRDADGHVYLVDRKKDMLIRGGENIYSPEVEAALICHPKVALAAVVAVPDPIFGEVPFAFILSAEAADPPTREELIGHCAGMLAAYKIPQLYAFIAEMPMTATGKIQKGPLRAATPGHLDAPKTG